MSVYIQAVKKRAFLRQVAERAKNNALTLRETLIAVQGGQFSSTFQGGKILASTSGSGQSGSFEMSVQGKEWTPDNVFGLTEELIELLDATISESIPDEAEETAIDTLFTAMIADDQLQSVTRFSNDYTGLRFTQ